MGLRQRVRMLLLALAIAPVAAVGQSGTRPATAAAPDEMKDLINRCGKAPAKSVEAATCSARLACIERGHTGPKLEACATDERDARLASQRRRDSERAVSDAEDRRVRAETEKKFDDQRNWAATPTCDEYRRDVLQSSIPESKEKIASARRVGRCR